MRFIYLLFILIHLNLYSQNQPKKQVDSVSFYIQNANFNSSINNYKDALVFAQKAIYKAEAMKDDVARINAMSAMSSVYFKLKKYNDALSLLEKSIALFDVRYPSAAQANVYFMTGLCYMEKENIAKAEINFKRAESIYTRINLPEAIELLNLQNGIVYKSKGQNELALTLFKKNAAKDDTDDIFKTKAEALYQIGTIEIGRKRINLALDYLKRALKLNGESKNLEQKSNILKSLSLVYEKMLDNNNAFICLKEHLKIEDTILILNNVKIAENDYDKFKEIEKLRDIERIENQYKDKQNSNKFSKLISILAIALISILSLLSLSLYKNNIIRKQTNFLLKEKNSELLIAKNNAEKASKARNEFLSTVSHELRTPLNAINGITHLLLEENPKESQLDYLESLKFSGNYLSTFINEILEINRIESSAIGSEKINFNLKKLLGNIKHSLKEIANNNKNKFTIEVDDNIPDNLIGDPTKLSQIFINLINNSLKFTKNGSVRVTAKLVYLELDFTQIHFEVTDDGIGIPEDKLSSVFESFEQGSVEINRKYGGTGLGLAIVKNLVELLGGKIELESQIGKGTKFYFDLKIKINNQFVVKKPKLVYDSEKLIKKNILLVEDNKINQMITKKMLENKQILCTIIDNGEDAVNEIRANKYDLVLMDVHLPGINGTIATEQVRIFDTKTPIIALTAISLSENREMLLSFGMNDVITKPFDPENFYAMISKYVQ